MWNRFSSSRVEKYQIQQWQISHWLAETVALKTGLKGASCVSHKIYQNSNSMNRGFNSLSVTKFEWNIKITAQNINRT